MDVFLTSPWIPPEWIRAHGLQARGLWSAENFPRGAWPISAGVCAFAEAAVRFAETRTDSAVIFSTACDQLRRGFDTAVLHGNHHAFLFNLPATWETPAAGQIFRSELERLGQFLKNALLVFRQARPHVIVPRCDDGFLFSNLVIKVEVNLFAQWQVLG